MHDVACRKDARSPPEGRALDRRPILDLTCRASMEIIASMTLNARTLSAVEANGTVGMMADRVAMCCRMCR